MSPYRHEIWTNASMTSFRSPRTSAGVKLLTTHCPDGGQNFFLGGQIINFRGRDCFFYMNPTSLWWWCEAVSHSLSHLISIHESDCSSFCPTFSFRIEDMPILLQFSHHAVCCMACCEVQMTIHTSSVGGGYGLPLIPRKQNTWQ